MLELRRQRLVGTGTSVLLRIGDGSTDCFPGSLASFRQSIVPGIKILPVLHMVTR